MRKFQSWDTLPGEGYCCPFPMGRCSVPQRLMCAGLVKQVYMTAVVSP